MAVLDPDALLNDFYLVETNALAKSTQQKYEYTFKQFEQFISKLPGADQDNLVSLRNVKMYLAYRKNTNKTYNTILVDITAIRYFCEKQHIQDITKEPEIKFFKKGLKRLLQAGKNPYAAKPLQKEQLLQQNLLKINFNFFIINFLKGGN